MKKYIPTLAKTQLFLGVSEEEIEIMLDCLKSRVSSYKKGEYIFRQGQQIYSIAILVRGVAHIRSDDYWGYRSILRELGEGSMFGESYAASSNSTIINDVVAVKDCQVIFFDVARMLSVCSNTCIFHTIVVRNLLFSVCEQNRALVQKLGYMSMRTTREKLTSYLSAQAKRAKSPRFTISFNRQQLADYLSVDRSAMSRELCKMRDEGLLRFNKNRFTLL